MRKKHIIIAIKLNKKYLAIALLMGILSIAFFTYSNEMKSVFYHCHNKVVVDPGHGGIDGGTGEDYGILEKNINLDIGLKLKRDLLRQNFEVLMTREKDESLEEKSCLSESRHKRDLDGRTQIINNSGADVFVSIHVNANPFNLKSRGIQVYYHPDSMEEKRLAQCICSTINEIVYKNDPSLTAYIVAEDFFILRESSVPGVLVETGFITNSQDRKLLQSQKYYDKISLGIVKGIIKYFGK